MNTEQAATLTEQIGRMTIFAISGGRVRLTDGTLVLPVASGYTVEIDYCEGSDTYTVRRVFTRAGKRFIKGEITNVYCDQVGELAYRAHAFRSYEFGEAVTA
jgi:hypothetical protein